MAIDPSKSIPDDVATVSSLQSMTEESAKDAMRAPIDAAWGSAHFSLSSLLSTLGKIIGGAVNLGVGVLVEVAKGVIDFIGGIASAIGNLFGGSGGSGSGPPPPPIFNPIQTNLEAVLKPRFDEVDQLLDESDRIGGRIDDLNGELGGLVKDLDPTLPDSKLWEINAELHALSQSRDDVQDTAIKALELAQKSVVQTISRVLFVPRGQPVYDDYIAVSVHPSNVHRWRVTAKPGWVGHYVWQSVRNVEGAATIDGRNVGGTLTRTNDEEAYNRHQSLITYHVFPGVARDQYIPHLMRDIPRDEWNQIWDFTASGDYNTNYLVYYRAEWANANYLDSFGIRIMLTRRGVTTQLQHIGPMVRFGPVFGNDSRTMTITLRDVELRTGDRISFQAWAGGENPVNRRLSGETRISWIAPPSADDLPQQ